MASTTFDEYPRPLKDDEPIQIGKWKILHVIGAGGMGVVFNGNFKDDTKAAIKIINPEYLSSQLMKRFEFEITAHKLINSPYVAKLIDSDLENDPAYMALEFIHGKTLSKIIENNVRISEPLWNIYAKQIFLGLEQIHSRTLVHRDIKPANIMKLEDKEMLKIIDLGIVKNEDRQTSNRTTLVGTLPYMSPEQLKRKSATQKSDIFSAGITLVELFTKKHPFLSSSNYKSIESAIIDNEPDLEGLSSKQKELCEKLLKKNPAERITASEAIAILESYSNARAVIKRIPIKNKVVPEKKKELSKTIDPVLVGLIDEFDPSTFSIIKGPLIGMSVPVEEIPIKPSLKKIPSKEIMNFIKINNKFLSQINSKVFHIDFYSTKFKAEVYFQGFVDKEDHLLVEAMSDEFLEIKFSEEQKKLLIDLGWNPPTSTNPNYSLKVSNSDLGLNQASNLISETAFYLYEATKNTEIFISPVSEKLISEVKKELSINISSDGSFKLTNEVAKNNQYEKWQIIGFFEKDSDNDLILTTLVARHIENNKTYKRENKSWTSIGVFDNPIKNGISKLKVKNGFAFDKSLINMFDKSELADEYMTFEMCYKYLNYVPNLSAKYTDQEKIWPLTNEMIELGSDTASDFDDYLGLFTLSSSNINKNIVLGLFAKHPQTQKFYGRSEGKWKILFESPLTYGHEIFFVDKSFIEFYDKKSKNPDKPIKHIELENFIHNPGIDSSSKYLEKKIEAKKYKYSELPISLRNLMKEMVERVETKIGKEKADEITLQLRTFMKDKDQFSQEELVPLMAKLLRVLAN